MPHVPAPRHAPRPAPRARCAGLLGVVLAVLGGLLLAPAGAATAAPSDVVDGLVLRYDLSQTSGTAVVDTSGHGRDGTLTGGGTWTGAGGLALDGVDDHVKLPNDVMAGLSSITVSTDVYVDPTQATPFFIWGLGNTASSGSGTGYLMASGNRC